MSPRAFCFLYLLSMIFCVLRMIFSVYGTNLVGITFTIATLLLKLCSCKENYREFSSYNHVIDRRIVVFLGLLNCHSLHVEAQVL